MFTGFYFAEVAEVYFWEAVDQAAAVRGLLLSWGLVFYDHALELGETATALKALDEFTTVHFKNVLHLFVGFGEFTFGVEIDDGVLWAFVLAFGEFTEDFLL